MALKEISAVLRKVSVLEQLMEQNCAALKIKNITPAHFIED